ncbi:MAG: CooT family nickel-binding protein [Candidatus Scalindua sp.]|nr:CooT family nickel-binding protein [Candidatus Scalindua sp.]
MCQMKIMQDKDGQQELVMEDVSQLEVVEDGIRISTLFEEPKLIPGVTIKTIDFLSGKTILQAK